MPNAKVLLIDLETAPLSGYFWGLYDQNISSGQIIQYSRMLTWAAKWLGEEVVHYDAQYLYPRALKKSPEGDKEICDTLWDLVDKADIVVAHNGNSFDCKVMHARFLVNGFPPPSPYRQVDTLLMARRMFKFASNKLDDLGIQLGLGRKIDTGGFQLWRDIVEKNDIDAWKRMVEYNVGDVELLEKVYLALRPYDKQHPNLFAFTGGVPKCTSCGSKRVRHNGTTMRTNGTFQRYKCYDCGKQLVGEQVTKTDNPIKGA